MTREAFGENSGWVVGVDIGGTRIRLCCVDRKGNLRDFNSFWTDEFREHPQVDEALADVIYEYILTNRKSPQDLVGVVVGIPGTLNRVDGLVYSCPNFRALEGKRLRTTLQRRLLSSVLVENDANLAVLGEQWLGAAQGYQDVLGVFVGTGLGCGIILANRLHLGAHGVSAELGHIPVLGRSEFSGCGNKGCIELYGAGIALERMLRVGPEPRPPIQDMFIHTAGKEGYWKSAVEKFLEALSSAIATAVNILDPQIVVLGGGVLELKGFPFEDLVGRVLARVRKPEPAQSLCVTKTLLGDKATLIGAGRMGFQLSISLG